MVYRGAAWSEACSVSRLVGLQVWVGDACFEEELAEEFVQDGDQTVGSVV